jgi:hypothetical protein
MSSPTSPPTAQAPAAEGGTEAPYRPLGQTAPPATTLWPAEAGISAGGSGLSEFTSRAGFIGGYDEGTYGWPLAIGLGFCDLIQRLIVFSLITTLYWIVVALAVITFMFSSVIRLFAPLRERTKLLKFERGIFALVHELWQPFPYAEGDVDPMLASV